MRTLLACPDVRKSNRYRSLLMRHCFKALDDYVAHSLHVIHSPARIKQSGLTRWKMAVWRQKRSRKLDAVNVRHSRLLASKLQSTAFKRWVAAKMRNGRLTKARRLWKRRVLAKAQKLWRRVTCFERSSRRACLHFLRAKRASRLKSIALSWRSHAKAEKSARQIHLRSHRRARFKLKSACMRIWDSFVWRRMHCSRVGGIVASHERMSLQAVKWLCLMAWARLGAFGRAEVKNLSKADRIHRCKVKASTCLTWSLESVEAKVSRQRQTKSDRAGVQATSLTR